MSFSCSEYFVGDLVERELEGMYFPARILAVQPSDKYRITFLDDGNVEDNVPGGDLRRPEDKEKLERMVAPEKKKMILAPASNIPPTLYGRKESKGEDREDEGVANLEQPKVLNHDELRNEDTGVRVEVEAKGIDPGDENVEDEAIMLNGEAGIALPRGGGLKALRALRK